ncbi:ArsR/SmtB family transcription factor [Microbacterium rhizophilus]|uniref:ArsR/SmtB family transcription factor n=1 Tax=Microbacterium rhizophilus TaxID=3138934 RepID=UPI0031E839AD
MSEEKVQPEPRQRRTLDVAALRALGHPLRMRILDLLSQHGPQTSSTLAELTGESSGSTSYHLRILAKQDLIREIPERSAGRERWWERPPGSVSWGDGAETRSPAGRAALQAATAEFHRLRNDETTDYFTRRADREPEEWREVSASFTTIARMTPAQLAELSQQVEELITAAGARYRDQEGEGVRAVTVRADLFPLKQLGGAS